VTPSPFIQAYRTSITKALKQPDGPRRDAVIKAIRDEVQQIIDVGAIAPARFELLNEGERKKVIPSHLFVTTKYDAQGNFVREKGRWVASGNFLDTMGMDVQRSPTVNQSSVMILLSIAATARYDILTGDIKGAYLYTSIKEDEPQIYMWVDKDVADILCEVSPEYRQHRRSDGRILVQLKRYLYGLPQAAHQFHKYHDHKMKSLGFKSVRGDACVWMRGKGDMKIYVCAHVDDLLIAGKPDAIRQLRNDIDTKYTMVWTAGKQHSYIGLDITITDTHKILVSQKGYREDILKRFELYINKKQPKLNAPCNSTIFLANNPNEDVSRDEAKRIEYEEGTPMLSDDARRSLYVSAVMSLMYLARYTRVDILFATTVHATRCANPTHYDWMRVVRTLRYLRNSGDYCIELKPGKSIVPEIYADASHLSHHDAKGHGCMIVTLGNGGYIFARSSKLKLTTASATESEHYSLCEAAMYNIWLRDMLRSLRVKLDQPTIIHQDNNAAITMIDSNSVDFWRNKHWLVRRNYIREEVDNKECKLKYTPTEDMIADMGTKPLTAKTLKIFMGAIGMRQVNS
jgi:hypothetical protein